jgi:hypothetical protein
MKAQWSTVILTERKESAMPFARIGLDKDPPAGGVRIVGKAVCGAMTGTADVPVSGGAGTEGPGTLASPVAGEM